MSLFCCVDFDTVYYKSDSVTGVQCQTRGRLFSKCSANITHKETQPLSDITVSSLSDYMQLPLDYKKLFTATNRSSVIYLLRYGNHGIITVSEGLFSSQPICSVCSKTTIRSYLLGILFVSLRTYVFAVAFRGRLEFKAYNWSVGTLMCLAEGQLSSADQSATHCFKVLSCSGRTVPLQHPKTLLQLCRKRAYSIFLKSSQTASSS